MGITSTCRVGPSTIAISRPSRLGKAGIKEVVKHMPSLVPHEGTNGPARALARNERNVFHTCFILLGNDFSLLSRSALSKVFHKGVSFNLIPF